MWCSHYLEQEELHHDGVPVVRLRTVVLVVVQRVGHSGVEEGHDLDLYDVEHRGHGLGHVPLKLDKVNNRHLITHTKLMCCLASKFVVAT